MILDFIGEIGEVIVLYLEGYFGGVDEFMR